MTYRPSASITTRHGIDSLSVIDGFAATQTTHFESGDVNAQIAFMLIDISDTTNWKHTNTDHIILRHALIEVDPDSSFLGEVRIGFLDNVGATNGEFHQIIDIHMARKSDLIIENLTFEGGFHCQNASHFGPHTVSTLFQTDVNLGGPDDPATLTYPSGNGDLVCLIERSAGVVGVSTTIIYETVGA